MIRLETANTLLAADTPATGRDALTKGVDMDQPTELLLPILPFLVQVFPTPGTLGWVPEHPSAARRAWPQSRRLGMCPPAEASGGLGRRFFALPGCAKIGRKLGGAIRCCAVPWESWGTLAASQRIGIFRLL